MIKFSSQKAKGATQDPGNGKARLQLKDTYTLVKMDLTPAVHFSYLQYKMAMQGSDWVNTSEVASPSPTPPPFSIYFQNTVAEILLCHLSL